MLMELIFFSLCFIAWSFESPCQDLLFFFNLFFSVFFFINFSDQEGDKDTAESLWRAEYREAA